MWLAWYLKGGVRWKTDDIILKRSCSIWICDRMGTVFSDRYCIKNSTWADKVPRAWGTTNIVSLVLLCRCYPNARTVTAKTAVVAIIPSNFHSGTRFEKYVTITAVVVKPSCFCAPGLVCGIAVPISSSEQYIGFCVLYTLSRESIWQRSKFIWQYYLCSRHLTADTVYIPIYSTIYLAQ